MFDIIVTNPPFGKKLAIDTTETLQQFDLGHKWKVADDGNFVKAELYDKQPPQLLFSERCLSLLKSGGKLSIVLLESIFGIPKYQYVVNYIIVRAPSTVILRDITRVPRLFRERLAMMIR
jgi:type I restriction enzyme M protein